MALPLGRSILRKQPQLPPVLSKLRDFSLTNQEGQLVSMGQFKGKVVVANFIFTSCPGICPLLTDQMRRLQKRVAQTGNTVQLLSISVDPETDTPAVLKGYAEKHKADFKNWSFLTGDLKDIEDIVVKGFRLGLDRNKEQGRDTGGVDSKDVSSLMDITHGEHFVVIDQLARIRSYRMARNDSEIGDILQDVTMLLNSDPHALPDPMLQ